jgi:hypothetical protein
MYLYIIIFLIFILYCVIISFVSYKFTRSTIISLISFFILPAYLFWDVGPNYLKYKDACSNNSGIKINKKINGVGSFLIKKTIYNNCYNTCGSILSKVSYDFLEVSSV